MPGRNGRNGHDGPAALRSALPYLVRTAARAPSPANSQPWRFRMRGGAVELLVETHPLTGLGPESIRQATLAAGAALYNLRLAVGHLGYEPHVTLYVDEADGDLLAQLRAGNRRPPEPDDERLLAAVNRRHSHRGAFDPEGLSDRLVARLADAALAEEARLLDRTQGPQRHTLDAIVDAGGGDDDPVAVAGLRAPWVPMTGGEESRTLVLVTDDDDRAAWFRAGQALQRLLLEAAAVWAFARLTTAPLEAPGARERVRREVCDGSYPQVILQMGHLGVAPSTARSGTDALVAATR